MEMVRPYGRDHVASVRAQIDLRELAAGFTTLQGNKEQWGPCPKCGGHDRFHVQKDVFFCRQCRPAESGKRHDVFDFVLWMGLAHTFPEAVSYVEQWQGLAARGDQPKRVHELFAHTEWHEHAQRYIFRAKERLASHKAREVQQYLEKRCISRQVCDSHHLGASWVKGVPVVTIPWFSKGKVVCIQMRYVRDVNGKRYKRWGFGGYYGRQVLYKARQKPSNVLVITEGELNCLSTWSATPYNCVSFGSQSLTIAAEEAIAELSQSYQKVFVWCDQETVAYRVAGLVGSKAQIISSPYDANECLQRNILGKMFA